VHEIISKDVNLTLRLANGSVTARKLGETGSRGPHQTMKKTDGVPQEQSASAVGLESCLDDAAGPINNGDIAFLQDARQTLICSIDGPGPF
jgi:hypothetical protein